MLVRELMSTTVASARPSSSLDAAVRVLAEQKVSALPVVDPSGRVVGILSEADVLRLQVTTDPRAHARPTPSSAPPWPDTVGEAMTPDPVTVTATGDVGEAALLMADTGWKSLPVVDRGVLVGMVSRSDVIRALSTSDGEIWRHVTHDFGQITRPDWTVTVTRGVVTVHGVAAGRDARLADAIAATAPGVRRVVVVADAATHGQHAPDSSVAT